VQTPAFFKLFQSLIVTSETEIFLIIPEYQVVLVCLIDININSGLFKSKEIRMKTGSKKHKDSLKKHVTRTKSG
jgi:hypothetical protein